MLKNFFRILFLGYVLGILWIGFYFPGPKENQLNQEFIAATQQILEEWSMELDEYESLDGIVSGIKELSPAQVDSVMRVDIATEQKRVRRSIDQAKRIQAITGSDTIQKLIELAEEQFESIENSYSPDEYYRYSNIHQLLDALHYFEGLDFPVPPAISILRNIERGIMEEMTAEEQLEYLNRQVEFEILAHFRFEEKKSRYIKKNDTIRHALFTKALVSNGSFVYEKTNPVRDTGVFIRQLTPIESNVCLVVEMDDSSYYDAVEEFRQKWRSQLAFYILFLPVLYLIADSILCKTAAKKATYYEKYIRAVPTIWRILRGLRTAFWISMLYIISSSLLILFMAADFQRMEGDVVVILSGLFVMAFASIMIPVVVLVRRIRWLFRHGSETECEYLMEEEIEKIKSVRLYQVMRLYFFSFQDKYHKVKGRFLKNYEDFENGKLRLTALFNPNNPRKAIIMDYYQDVSYEPTRIHGGKPRAIAWKFKAAFSHPFKSEITDIGIIESDQIMETFEKIPWKDLMEKMIATDFKDVYDLPRLIFERIDSRKQIVIELFERDKWSIDYYRLKTVMQAINPSGRRKIYDKSGLIDESIDVVRKCLKALMKNDQEFFNKIMPPIRY